MRRRKRKALFKIIASRSSQLSPFLPASLAHLISSEVGLEVSAPQTPPSFQPRSLDIQPSESLAFSVERASDFLFVTPLTSKRQLYMRFRKCFWRGKCKNKKQKRDIAEGSATSSLKKPFLVVLVAGSGRDQKLFDYSE